MMSLYGVYHTIIFLQEEQERVEMSSFRKHLQLIRLSFYYLVPPFQCIWQGLSCQVEIQEINTHFHTHKPEGNTHKNSYKTYRKYDP